MTQKIAPDYQPLSNREAWLALDRLMEDEATGFETEPAGLDLVWRNLSETQTSSPKVWMDAYLAAFAISGGMRLATLDKVFGILKPKILICWFFLLEFPVAVQRGIVRIGDR